MRADDFSRTSVIHRSPIVAILTRFSPAFIISIATVSVFAPKMIVRSGFHSLATVFSYLALAPCPSQAFVISPVTSGYTSHTANVGALPRSIDLFWFAKDLRGVPSVLLAGNDDISIDEAFTDQIDFFGDPMIRTMFGVFGVAIILLMGASLVMNKMDSAIENVLSDFESVMSSNFAARWIELEEELEGLDKAAKSERLIKIMEEMERDEPKLMAKVNAAMAEKQKRMDN